MVIRKVRSEELSAVLEIYAIARTFMAENGNPKQCGNLKMDTYEDNKVMQHVLDKNGFVRCGRICIADGLRMIRISKGAVKR